MKSSILLALFQLIISFLDLLHSFFVAVAFHNWRNSSRSSRTLDFGKYVTIHLLQCDVELQLTRDFWYLNDISCYFRFYMWPLHLASKLIVYVVLFLDGSVVKQIGCLFECCRMSMWKLFLCVCVFFKWLFFAFILDIQ